MRIRLVGLLLCVWLLWGGAALAQVATAKELTEKARLFNNNMQYDSAVYYADSAINLSVKTGDHSSRLKAMRFKGKSLLHIEREKEAIELYFAAEKLCRDPEDAREKALIYGELGYAYFREGHSTEAKNYFRQQIQILTDLLGRDSVGNQLMNFALTYQKLNEQDSAGIIFDKIADILSRINDSTLMGYYFFNMGVHQTMVNHPDSAAYFYLKARDIWMAVGNEPQLFKVTFNLGFYYYQKHNYKSAIESYLESLDAAGKYGAKQEIAHIYGTMGESYAALNDYKNAYRYVYLYATLNDSFNKEDISNYAIKLDKQFQAEKSRELIREQELELKTANLAVQKQQNTILLIAVILVLAVCIGGAAFAYLTFRNRVRKQVDEAKTRFFANVAHEIRTPLSMIKGPIEILQSRVEDSQLQYQLSIAARNTDRLNALITQMLDISRIDAAHYELHLTVGDLNVFAEQLFAEYRMQAAEKQITLTCIADTVQGNALFDKDVLEKIIGNLAGNAIKYTPAGGAAGIEVRTTRKEAGLELLVNVWDSGPGIPAGEQQKIFDRFYRSADPQRAGVKGIGIGLSLVKELVALIGGSISITSTVGKGCVFSVVSTLAMAPEAASASSNTENDRQTILLVEDDKDILSFNTALLQEQGYKVLAAEDGNRASELLRESLPDLVITDLMLPGRSGLELLREMRSGVLTAHIPAIILSARVAGAAKTEGIEAGAQVYLSKPFSPAELVSVVKSQLQLLARLRSFYQEAVAVKENTVEERYEGVDPFTQKTFALIQEHLDDHQLSVEKLADMMHVNRSHFQRKIKTLTGSSPSELIRTIRLEKAKELLLKKEHNITETAYATGFTSQSYFTKCFSDHFGYPPSQVQ